MTLTRRSVVGTAAPAVPPSTTPALVDIYAGWTSLMRSTYRRSSRVDATGAIGIQRAGQSIGLDSNGAIVYNDLPFGWIQCSNQRHSSKFMSIGLAEQVPSYIDDALRSLEYTFSFQDFQGRDRLSRGSTGDGGFPYVGTSIYPSPAESDRAQTTYFFFNDLAQTLLLTKDSSYWASSTCDPYRVRLAKLIPGIGAMLTWYLSETNIGSFGTRRNTCLMNDRKAPNRLLFAGVGLYQMGLYFSSKAYIDFGLTYINKAVAMQCNDYAHATSDPLLYYLVGDGYSRLAFARTTDYLAQAPLGWGWMAEQGGSDTSYHAVNLRQLAWLYASIPLTHTYLRTQIFRVFKNAILWMRTRIDNTGFISLQDNTRVFNGGEEYLGKPKVADWIEAMIGFGFYGMCTNDSSYITLADQVMQLYTARTFTPNSSQIYTLGRSKLLSGDIDWINDSIRICLVQTTGTHNTPYTFSAAHTNISSIATNAIAEVRDILQGKSINGTQYLADSCFFDNISPLANAAQVNSAVVYHEQSGIPLAYLSGGTGFPQGFTGEDAKLLFTGIGYVLTTG